MCPVAAYLIREYYRGMRFRGGMHSLLRVRLWRERLMGRVSPRGLE